MTRCANCGAETEVVLGTLTDDSGGASVRLCDECRDIIQTPRCGFCGHAKTGSHKADRLHLSKYENDGYNAAVDVCDQCRDRLLFARAAK